MKNSASEFIGRMFVCLVWYPFFGAITGVSAAALAVLVYFGVGWFGPGSHDSGAAVPAIMAYLALIVGVGGLWFGLNNSQKWGIEIGEDVHLLAPLARLTRFLFGRNDLEVTVDPNRSWKEVMENLKTAGYEVCVDPSFDPNLHLSSLDGGGKIRVRVKLFKRRERTTTHKWSRILAQGGRRFAHPLVALAVAAQFPGRVSWSSRIFVVWKIGNQMWDLIAGIDDDGHRYVSVHPAIPGSRSEWLSFCRPVAEAIK